MDFMPIKVVLRLSCPAVMIRARHSWVVWKCFKGIWGISLPLIQPVQIKIKACLNEVLSLKMENESPYTHNYTLTFLIKTTTYLMDAK